MNNPNEYFKKGFNDFYKQYFGNNKDTNFMLKVKDEFFQHTKSRTIINKVFNGPNFGIDSLMFETENPDFEIAKNIFMIFKENTQHLSNEDKLELRKDKNYINKLIEQVHVQLSIRKYGTELVRRDFYDQYAPSIYSVRALISYTAEVLQNKIKTIEIENVNFFYTMMIKIINKTVACLSLMEINLHEEAFSHLRSVTELYLIYFVLVRREACTIETYTKHVKWGFEFNSTGEYPKEFIDKFNKISKPNKCSKMDYLNYGWLDEIYDYMYLGNKRYKLNDLAQLIDLKQDNGKRVTLGKTIYAIYKHCNPLAHGSTNVLDNKLAQKVLIQDLGTVIHNISYDISTLTKDKFIYNTVDLFDYFNHCIKCNRMQLNNLNK